MEDILKKYFGYEQFRPLQKEIIERTLLGKDSVVLMPTGGGKSLCFQLPALMQPGITLVISPLISLMKDQVDALATNGIAADLINSTLTAAQISGVMERAMAGTVKILYIAPERLGAAGFEDFLHSLKLSLIAIDEAHCISEWGHDFRPDYRNLKTLRGKFPGVPIMALTATATQKVREDIISQLDLKNHQVFISSFNRPNLNYQVLPKKDSIKSILKLLGQDKAASAIIYCFSRNDTEQLVAQLNHYGFLAAAYHAGLNAKTRQENQEKFIKDEVMIMVATIAFGMGIDKPDVRMVIHHSLPKSIEGYYQETGRAGRDGLPARCVLLFSYADKFKHDFFLQNMKNWEERQKAEENMQHVLDYGNLQTCRRQFLLSYFNEDYQAVNCGNCDRCVQQPAMAEATPLGRRSFLPPVSSGAPTAVGARPSHDPDPILFDQLRKLRTKEALRLNVPPYVVFGDKALTQMASDCPQTSAEFLEIYGVGQQKLTQFGAQFLAVIRQYVVAQGASDAPSLPVIDINEGLGHFDRTSTGTYQQTKALAQQKMSIEDIARVRNLSQDTILSHLEKIAVWDKALDLSHLKPSPERFAVIVLAFQKTGGPALNPVRQILGESYSYEELRRARLFLKS